MENPKFAFWNFMELKKMCFGSIVGLIHDAESKGM